MLLAEAANRFLQGLLRGLGAVPAAGYPQRVTTEMETDEEREQVDRLAQWAVSRGLSEPEHAEIPDPVTGETIAVAELAWPHGLQEGLGDPVVLDLELSHEGEARLARLGYRVFSDQTVIRA